MQDYENYFRGKKVTVMGLGLLGRGVGDAAYIAEAGAAEVIVTDLKTQEQLQESFNRLKEYENVTFRLGEHVMEDFVNRDLVLVAAGVPMDSEFVEHARQANIPLKQSAALFAELAKIPIIGVTGTRGKSTVTQMIHHVLSFVTGEQILLGGNLRGLSNLQLLSEVKEDSIAVMELDSWQLQGFGWAEISPQIAVFTNFMEDHLNYYQKGTMTKEEAMDRYFADKANIFKYQEESGVLVTTPDVFTYAKQFSSKNPRAALGFAGEVILADASVIPEDCLLAMPGEHNLLNAALAYQALKAISLSDEEIFAGLASFPGVEGRLQLVKTIDTVRIYNDNNATTPQAATVALEALDVGNKNIILICGGADKNIALEGLVGAIIDHCKQVILIPGTGTDRLLETLKSQSELNGQNLIIYNKILTVENLTQAFEEARLAAKNGDIILFSPAFASFSQYTNEYERNDEFMSLVEKV